MIQNENIIRRTQELLSTPLLADNPIQTIGQLRIFMEHHVFAVWDFMCLAKALQHAVAPSSEIWSPPRDRVSARVMNEIITVEETDLTIDGKSYCSHFELYIKAMEEVGADTRPICSFLNLIRTKGIDFALTFNQVPDPARLFMKRTLSFLREHKPWVTGAAFFYGREDVIPHMFRALIGNKVISSKTCPTLEYYLTRHIDIDGGNNLGPGHADMGAIMLESLCANDSVRYFEAEQAAIKALNAREKLWEGVYRELEVTATPV